MNDCTFIDIVIHSDECVKNGGYVQAKYLVHGLDDVLLWTNNKREALAYFREELKRL